MRYLRTSSIRWSLLAVLGLAGLVAASRRARAGGGSLMLVGASRAVREAIETLGLRDEFEFPGDEPGAPASPVRRR